MFQKNYIYILGFFLSVFFMSCQSEKESSNPNILLISVDDMGWSDIGCYGSEINTPNIDRMAENGMRFRNFYNTSKCFPSRACLITGVYAQDCGYAETHMNPITNAVTIGEVLQNAGYLTYWSGKHHGLENPYERGFDHYFGLKDGCCNHFNPGNQREGEPAPARKKNNRWWAIDSAMYCPYTPDKAFYTTDRFTDYALKYIDEAAERQDPFFLYLSITAPHDPLMAWPDDIAKYKGKYKNGYEAVRKSRYQKQLELGVVDSSYHLSDPTYRPWNSLSDKEKSFEAAKMEVYAAMIDRVDQNIGRVLKRLEEYRIKESTLVVFVSDNGASAEIVNLKNDDNAASVGSISRWVSLGKDWANVSNTPYFFYKNSSHEGGIKTPCIAYWPNEIEPGSFTEFPGHFIDFMATFVDITGAEYPKEYNGQMITPMKGKSLLPVLKGMEIERDKPLFWEWRQGRAVRDDGWKLVKEGLNNPWELYNMVNDPTESNDLADSFPDKVAKLDSLFNVWHER